MNGHILEGFPIAVDYFSSKIKNYVEFYFLTHMHTDHTVGLTSKWLKMIHCTPITAKLLHHKFNISLKYIKTLEEGQTHLIQNQNISFSVRVIPANHCPGACMFLFDFDNYRILYTGDFRLNSEIHKEIVTHCGKENLKVDLLYLDNTYCHPACSFSTQDIATDMVIKLCQHFSDYRIKIGTSWTGHEILLINVAKALNEYIYVDSSMLTRLKLLNLPDVFTKDATSRIHAISNCEISKKSVENWNKSTPTISIKPTAMFWENHTTLPNIEQKLMHVVPYSNHCNYSEICGFVKLVAPSSITPIVSGKRKTGMESYIRADMEQFSHFLSGDVTKKALNRKENIRPITCTLYADKNSKKTDNFVLKKRKLNRKIHSNKKRKISEKRGVIYDDEITKTNNSKIPESCKEALSPTVDEIIAESAKIPDNNKKTRKKCKRSVCEVIEKEILADLDNILTKVSIDNLF